MICDLGHDINDIATTEHYQASPALITAVCLFDGLVKDKGGRLVVSPVSGAVGRHSHGTERSQHYTGKDGTTRAVDLQVANWDHSYSALLEAAKASGFTGVGIYKWKPYGYGVHVDVRAGRRVATWARIGKTYTSVAAFLQHYKTK